MSRYNDILSGADAAEIEYEGIDALEIKPTKGAMRVMDLLETFTGNYVHFVTDSRSIPWFGGV